MLGRDTATKNVKFVALYTVLKTNIVSYSLSRAVYTKLFIVH